MSKFKVDFSENEKKMNADFTDGVRALNGKPGKDGKDGKNGADGKSAYEVALQNGFEGTEPEWLESLKGQDGKDGRNGVDGKDGKDGVDGENGMPGIPGIDGKDGKHAYIFTSTGTGSAYVGSIDGYTEYNVGDMFVMIPHTAGTSTSPKLNINNLGSYSIQRRSQTYTMKSLRTSGCIASGVPEVLVFTGSCFMALSQYQPYGSTDFYTSVSVSKGGTGRTSWSSNSLIYASSSTTLSYIYPPSYDSVLVQKSGYSPYWESNENFMSGVLRYKGIHADATTMPPLQKGAVYKFPNGLNVVSDNEVTEVTRCVDSNDSIYFYEYGMEIYSPTSDSCFTELAKILPDEYVHNYSDVSFAFIVVPKSNTDNATAYVFHCNSTYSYYEDFGNDEGYYYSYFSGSWQDGDYPGDWLTSGDYITVRVPLATFPAGTYMCTGADWETLV